MLVLAAAVALSAAPAAVADNGGTPVYRFYNEGTGSHFYTISESEKADVEARWGDVYAFEGIGFSALPDDFGWWDPEIAAVAAPVYRFYNVKNGSHFYTISEAEKASVIAKYPLIYKFDGIAFRAATERTGGSELPVYRFYNKLNGSHFYTVSGSEKTLVQMQFPSVYKYEGIAFYVPGFMDFR